MKKFIMALFICFFVSTSCHSADWLADVVQGISTGYSKGVSTAMQLEQMRMQREQMLQMQQKQQMLESEDISRRFFQDLDFLCPNWRLINNDPNFTKWLSQIYPNTNYTRHQILHDAYSKYDSSTVSRIFNDFIIQSMSRTPTPQVAVSKTKLACEEKCRLMWKNNELGAGVLFSDCVRDLCE